MEFVYRVQGRRAQIWRALEKIINEELVLAPGEPNPEIVRMNRAAAEHCVLRFEEQIRSGIFNGVVLTDGGGESLRKALECLLEVSISVSGKALIYIPASGLFSRFSLKRLSRTRFPVLSAAIRSVVGSIFSLGSFNFQLGPVRSLTRPAVGSFPSGWDVNT